MLTQQGLISDQPHEKKVDRQKSEVDQQVQHFPDSTSEEAADAAEEEDAELIGFIRFAIAENDSQFARDIQKLLKEVCSAGAADRQKVWGSLTEAEKAAFLLTG